MVTVSPSACSQLAPRRPMWALWPGDSAPASGVSGKGRVAPWGPGCPSLWLDADGKALGQQSHTTEGSWGGSLSPHRGTPAPLAWECPIHRPARQAPGRRVLRAPGKRQGPGAPCPRGGQRGGGGQSRVTPASKPPDGDTGRGGGGRGIAAEVWGAEGPAPACGLRGKALRLPASNPVPRCDR